MVLHILKEIDIFKMPVKILLTKKTGKKKNKKKSIDAMGSQISGCVSLVFMFICLSYLIYILGRMFSGQDDIRETTIKTNHFDDGYEKIDVGEKNFLISIDMGFDGDKEIRAKHDVWKYPENPKTNVFDL